MSKKYSEEFVTEAFAATGLVFIPPYIGANSKTNYFCPRHPELGIQETRFTKYLHDLKKGTRVGCRKCGYEANSGENCHLWKGGVTPANELERSSPEFKEWREAVFKRDNYICQACGYTGGATLQAHHILNFSEYPSLRYEHDNGITLCAECHDPNILGSFHSIFGTTGNSLGQLLVYIFDKRQGKELPEIIRSFNYKAHNRLLSPEQVRKVRDMFIVYGSYKPIVKEFNISTITASRIVRGIYYKDETGGTRVEAERPFGSILTRKQAEEVKQRIENGERLIDISNDLGVGYHVIQDLKSGHRYVSVTGGKPVEVKEEKLRPINIKFTDNQVRMIKKEMAYMTVRSISRKYKVDEKTIYNIKNGKTYTWVE
ncbi:HNH endonuclease [Bacillus sp. CFBP 13597]|nr:HNH endonuclease [Bacillus sp. CFBP 13597]